MWTRLSSHLASLQCMEGAAPSVPGSSAGRLEAGGCESVVMVRSPQANTPFPGLARPWVQEDFEQRPPEPAPAGLRRGVDTSACATTGLCSRKSSPRALTSTSMTLPSNKHRQAEPAAGLSPQGGRMITVDSMYSSSLRRGTRARQRGSEGARRPPRGTGCSLGVPCDDRGLAMQQGRELLANWDVDPAQEAGGGVAVAPTERGAAAGLSGQRHGGTHQGRG